MDNFYCKKCIGSRRCTSCRIDYISNELRQVRKEVAELKEPLPPEFNYIELLAWSRSVTDNDVSLQEFAEHFNIQIESLLPKPRIERKR